MTPPPLNRYDFTENLTGNAAMSQVYQQPDLPYTLRKVLSVGKSHAITLPPRWYKAHVDPSHPYVTLRIEPDHTLTITSATIANPHELLATDPAG